MSTVTALLILQLTLLLLTGALAVAGHVVDYKDANGAPTKWRRRALLASVAGLVLSVLIFGINQYEDSKAKGLALQVEQKRADEAQELLRGTRAQLNQVARLVTRIEDVDLRIQVAIEVDRDDLRKVHSDLLKQEGGSPGFNGNIVASEMFGPHMDKLSKLLDKVIGVNVVGLEKWEKTSFKLRGEWKILAAPKLRSVMAFSSPPLLQLGLSERVQASQQMLDRFASLSDLAGGEMYIAAYVLKDRLVRVHSISEFSLSAGPWAIRLNDAELRRAHIPDVDQDDLGSPDFWDSMPSAKKYLLRFSDDFMREGVVAR